MARPHCLLAALVCAFGLAAPIASRAGTPAEARWLAGQAALDRASSDAERAAAWLALAEAHTARARETGDGSHYDRSLEALASARQAGAEESRLAKVEAWVRLGRHEFAAAEKLARRRLERVPDDHETWGLLGDALMERGRGDAAADAYQRMMDLRPGPGAYLRASYYRERVGDLEGARELLERALSATSPRETEQLAWILVHVAALDERLGRPERAEQSLHRALAWFPDYHYALSALARLELERGRPEPALALARRSLEVAPHAERWLILADALRALGREREARSAEETFEHAALANVDRADNENLFLVDYYLDRRPDPERALELARKEAARRPDPATLARLERAQRRARP